MEKDQIIEKVWITKYALTQGIIEMKDARLCVAISDRMITVPRTGKDVEQFGNFGETFHKPFWHTTEQDAIKHGIKLVQAKKKSLKKFLARMDALENKFIRKINPE